MRMRYTAGAASAAFAVACLCGLGACDRTPAGTARQNGRAASAAGDVRLRDTAAAAPDSSTMSAVRATPLYLPTLGMTITVPSATLQPLGASAARVDTSSRDHTIHR